MGKQTLHLEIMRLWWMWRGCLQDYYDGCDTEDIHEDHVGWDAMNLNGYEEASAFPVQKPNFDVFGIPRRTRSQRGWYQVQRRANANPHGLSVSPPPPDAPATGADLPWELVELVGEMMSERLSWSEDDDRRTMIACALVCRYWARHFLAKIFENTTLRSRRPLDFRENTPPGVSPEAHRARQWRDTPPNLASVLEFLQLNPAVGTFAWLDLVEQAMADRAQGARDTPALVKIALHTTVRKEVYERWLARHPAAPLEEFTRTYALAAARRVIEQCALPDTERAALQQEFGLPPDTAPAVSSAPRGRAGGGRDE